MIEEAPHPAVVAAMKAEIEATAALPMLRGVERLTALYAESGDLAPVFAALLIAELTLARIVIATGRP